MGFEIERHKEHFRHDEADDVWIPQVAARQWVILSGDKKLSKHTANIEAVRSACAQVILVTDSNSLPEQWAAAMIMGRHKIAELLEKHSGPIFIQLGQQAKDHVRIVKSHVLEKNPEAVQPAPPAPHKEVSSETVNYNTEAIKGK
jgi:PIN like domain